MFRGYSHIYFGERGGWSPFFSSSYFSVCRYVCISVCICICISVCISVCIFVYISVCISVSISVCICICIYICSTALTNDSDYHCSSEPRHNSLSSFSFFNTPSTNIWWQVRGVPGVDICTYMLHIYGGEYMVYLL